MARGRHEPPDPLEVIAGARPTERSAAALIGLPADEIVSLTERFRTDSRENLLAFLREEAGHPWAAHSFERTWDEDEQEARCRGLFDLIWHRRALAIDPIINVPAFSGFDVLMDAARRAAPELAHLLAHIDPHNPSNPRCSEGPDWWKAWHDSVATTSAGWLDADEVTALAESWWRLTQPELEEACVTMLGATYTHPGCWSLLSDLGGFFAQCMTEKRVVAVEADL